MIYRYEAILLGDLYNPYFLQLQETNAVRADTIFKIRNQIVENDSINPIDNAYIYNGGGVGVGDFNNDGLPISILKNSSGKITVIKF